ncbi:MAG: DNA primase [Candidatus Sumerlaeia bacterium]
MHFDRSGETVLTDGCTLFLSSVDPGAWFFGADLTYQLKRVFGDLSMNNQTSFRDFAQKVRTAADIEDVVSQYVELKPAGARMKACCPFHQEKTPSFYIHPGMQIFKCFGCGMGGDVITFIREIERVDFREALEILAKKYHLEMPRFNARAQDDKQLKWRQVLQDVLKQAADFYRKRLNHQEQGAFARRYLTERGIRPEIAASFQLGVAGDSWDDLSRYLAQKGFSEKALIDAGVSMQRKSGHGVYDYLRERLIFPILNRRGTAIGFGGRIFEGDGPKYLNSRETELFQKGRELYGLFQARDAMTRDKQPAVLVEGYMDVIGCHQAGVMSAVASLGTGLTPEQANLIHRFTREVVFLYDADEAGTKAIIRGLEILLGAGLEVRVGRMPEGEDPDSLAKKEGPEALQKVIEDAAPFFDFLIDQARKRYDMARPESRFAALELFEPVFSAIDEPLVLAGYITKLAVELGHEEGLLKEHLEQQRQRKLAREARYRENRERRENKPEPAAPKAVVQSDDWAPAPPPDLEEMEEEAEPYYPELDTDSSPVASPEKPDEIGELALLAGPASRREKGLLLLLMTHADARALARENMQVEWIEHPLVRYWTKVVLDNDVNGKELYHQLPEGENGREHRKFIEEVMLDSDETVAENYLAVTESLIDMIGSEFQLSENRRLSQKISELSRQGDMDAVRELLQLQKQNAQERLTKRNRATKENTCLQVRK